MASLRQQWKVSWDNGDEIEVTTTVRDLIDAVDMVSKTGSSNKVAVETALIHTALARSPHKVPPYEKWIEVLDMYREVPSANNGTGPTQQAASHTGQSSLAASQGQTGAAG